MAATGTLFDRLTFIEDEGLRWYAASEIAKRGFCQQCGSTLFWHENGAEEIAIAAGSIDGATRLKTVAHIFVEDKGDYYDLDENLPHHAEGEAGVVFPD